MDTAPDFLRVHKHRLRRRRRGLQLVIERLGAAHVVAERGGAREVEGEVGAQRGGQRRLADMPGAERQLAAGRRAEGAGEQAFVHAGKVTAFTCIRCGAGGADGASPRGDQIAERLRREAGLEAELTPAGSGRAAVQGQTGTVSTQ